MLKMMKMLKKMRMLNMRRTLTILCWGRRRGRRSRCRGRRSPPGWAGGTGPPTNLSGQPEKNMVMHINATNSKRDGISYLKDVGWKEREENNNQGEDQTDVLNPENHSQLFWNIENIKTYTKTIRRMTLSKRRSSENVLMRRSTKRKQYCTVNMDW